MKKTQFTALLLVVTIFATLAPAQKKGGGPGATNPGAIVSFGYCSTPGDNICEMANRLRSDQNRPYTNGSEGVTAVFNELSGSHDLTVGFGTRTVTYDLREDIAPGNPTPSWVGTVQSVQPFMNVLKAYNAKLLSGCSTAATCENDFVTGFNGGGFSISKITYRLQWNPTSVQPFVNTPYKTSAVNVHYHKGADGETFTITPLPTADTGRLVAGLQGQTNNGTITNGGQYVMGFTMTVKLQ